MKLYTINTVTNFKELIYDPFIMPFQEKHAELVVQNMMDDSLLADTRHAGGVTLPIELRLLSYVQDAQSAGASGILVTCTSITQATQAIRPLIEIPIVNIEEPVLRQALQCGSRIGILGSVSTSPAGIAESLECLAKDCARKISVTTAVAEGAFELLEAGERSAHDALILKEMKALAEKVDVIILAQVSMRQVETTGVDVPVLKMGVSGLEEIYAQMQKASSEHDYVYKYCPHCGTKLIKQEVGDDGLVPWCTNCNKPLFPVFSTCIISLVLNEKNEAALLRQGYISEKYYNLVSGYIQPGESAELSARREIEEELGLDVTELQLVGTWWFGKKDMLMIGFIAKTTDTQFKLSDEVDSAQWVPVDEAIGLVHPEGSVSYALLEKVCGNS